MENTEKKLEDMKNRRREANTETGRIPEEENTENGVQAMFKEKSNGWFSKSDERHEYSGQAITTDLYWDTLRVKRPDFKPRENPKSCQREKTRLGGNSSYTLCRPQLNMGDRGQGSDIYKALKENN